MRRLFCNYLTFISRPWTFINFCNYLSGGGDRSVAIINLDREMVVMLAPKSSLLS
jgi:hypothetical protein